MRIGLVAPPFLSVPPKRYGGTELFVAHLAEGLQQVGHEVIVYTVGDSTVAAPRKWLYAKQDWPLSSAEPLQFKDLTHSSWAVRDAAENCDLIHVQSAIALAFSPHVQVPFVYTLHHVHEDPLSAFYSRYPDVQFAAISDFQRMKETLPKIKTIHHGIRTELYPLQQKKEDYLVFLGRFAPVKGPEVAIEVAKKTGIPLKLAGEIQPIFKQYFEAKVKPHIDGSFIEYVGEANHETKVQLLQNAKALLFPIQWDEPFGLVMIESMACGTPVLALRKGSVPEVVRDGISGWSCDSVDEMVSRATQLDLDPKQVHEYCKNSFSLETMTAKYIELYKSQLGPSTGNDVESLPEEEEAAA